jgi:hypothetical protein
MLYFNSKMKNKVEHQTSSTVPKFAGEFGSYPSQPMRGFKSEGNFWEYPHYLMAFLSPEIFYVMFYQLVVAVGSMA